MLYEPPEYAVITQTDDGYHLTLIMWDGERHDDPRVFATLAAVRHAAEVEYQTGVE